MRERARKYGSILPLCMFVISLLSGPVLIVEFPEESIQVDERAVTKLGFDEDTSEYQGIEDATPPGDDYILYEHWEGYWVDAEKTSDNTDDDLLCWAATCSNILEYTGWGHVSGMWTSDEMFAYFQDHWTDEGSLMEYGWNWWFDGTEIDPGDGWASIDVAGGGNFWPSYTFSSYYHEQNDDASAMAAIDSYLHHGYGVGLAIYTDTGGGHAITCWGYDYNATDYLGLWITDSDDDKSHLSTDPPPDRLRYYNVAFNDAEDRWQLQDYYGSDNWYISSVQALERFPSNRPIADAGGPYIANEGDSVAFDASGTVDADGDYLYYRWDFDDDGTWDTSWQSNPYSSYVYPDHYTGDVVLQVYANRLLDTDTASVVIDDTAPIVNLLPGIETTLTFEEFSHEQNVGAFYPGVAFTDAICMQSPYYSGYALYPPHSGDKIVYTLSGSIRVDFDFTVGRAGAWFCSSYTLYIEAYDVWDNLIGVTSFTPGLYSSAYAEVWADGIKYLIIHDAGNYWSMDDLSYVPDEVRVITFEETNHEQTVGSFYPDVTFTNAIALQSPYYTGYALYPPHSGDKLVYTLSGTIRADFDYTVSKVGGWFTSLYTIYIEAYDEYGTLLDVASVQPGHYTQAYAEVAADGIKYVLIHDAGNYWTMDDMVYAPEWIVVDEGDIVDFTGSFYDPSPSDTHTIDWNFGDGTTQSGVLSVSHAYGDNGVFIATLTVTDDEGLYDSDSVFVISRNVAPSVDILTKDSQTPTVLDFEDLAEYQFVEAFYSGVTFTNAFVYQKPNYNWELYPPHSGTNVVGQLTGSIRVDFDFTVMKVGAWFVSPNVIYLEAYDQYGNLIATSSVTPGYYNSVYAEVIAAGISYVIFHDSSDYFGFDDFSYIPELYDEGELIQFEGTFSDPGWLDTHTIVWDFGDGASVFGTLTPTHAYGDNGFYTVTLTVTDDDGGVGVDSITIYVDNVAPSVWGAYEQPNPQFILPYVHNITFYGLFTDPGWLDSHTAVWDFGDGATYSGIDFYENDEPDAWGNCTAYHVYEKPGTYVVTLTVDDDDGGVGVFTTIVTVSTAEEAVQDLADYICSLPADAFGCRSFNTKKQFKHLLYEVVRLIEHKNYKGAYQILLHCIRLKADGFVDGRLRNDKILDPEAQEHICMKIDDIVAYLKILHYQKTHQHKHHCCFWMHMMHARHGMHRYHKC